jgi:hypothetical protein
MSIVTLKRKTEAKYNNSSVGLPHFSINGTLRNQGYVGQTSLSRFTSRTLYNGTSPRGYGGCCGKFKIGQMVQSGILPLNNPNVIKTSVVSSKGMIEEENKCLNSLRVQGWNKRLPARTPLTMVKPDSNQNINTQQDIVTKLAKNAIKDYNTCTPANTIKKLNTCKNRLFRTADSCNIAKDPSNLAAISQGESLIQLNNKCTNSNKKFESNTRRSPSVGTTVSR